MPVVKDEMTDSSREFHSRERKLSRLLGPYEKWIIKLQDCFSWDSPTITVSTLCIIHYIFWSIFMYGLRLYFILPSVALLLLLVDTWRNHIWPEIRLPPPYDEDTEDWTPVDPKAMSVPEISWHVAKVWCFVTKKVKTLKKQRLESPLLFVLKLSLLFIATGIIGLYVSGLMFSYSCIMLLFGWSGVKYLKLNEVAAAKIDNVKLSFLSSMPAFVHHMFQKQDSLCRSGIDEFLPKENPATMSVLSDALHEVDKDTRASEERMIPTVSSVLDSDLEFNQSQVSDNSLNFTMRETLLEQGLPAAFPGHDDLTDDELDKVYPDILPADAPGENDEDEDMKFIPTHFNGSDTKDHTEYSQAQRDDLNYNIASVLASGLQAIGTSVATAAAGLSKQSSEQSQHVRVMREDSSDFEPDSEDFVILDSPADSSH